MKDKCINKRIIKNKYVRRAKISEYKFRKMVKYFAEDLSATQISLLTALNRNTVNRYLNEIRGRIVEFCEQYAPFADELAKERQVAAKLNNPDAEQLSLSHKISTNLGILKRRGKVYAEMLANSTANKLKSLLYNKGKLNNLTELTVHAVDINEDDGLIAIGYDNLPAYSNKLSYVASLDNFWHFVQSRLSKFQGVARHKFYLHLKECEFRFNFRNDNLYVITLQLISSKPIT